MKSKRMFAHEAQRFSIRKYSFGATSVLLGCLLVLNGQVAAANQVSAEESVPASSQATSEVVPASSLSAPPTGSDATVAPAETAPLASTPSSSVPVSSASVPSDAADLAPAPTSQSAPVSSSTDAGTDTEESLAAASPAPSVASSSVDKDQVDQPEAPASSVQASATETSTVDADLEASEKPAAEPDLAVSEVTPAVSVTTSAQPLADVSHAAPTNLSGLQALAREAKPEADTGASLLTDTVRTPAVTDQPALPAQGIYVFKERTAVKNTPTVEAVTQFFAEVGEKINYDRIITSAGYQWISYQSYSGIRRYAAVAKEVQTSAPAAPKEDKATGKIVIENQTVQGFDVVVKNVTSPKELAEVQVPVWSAQAGQDDLVWYVATKQADNSYKTTVKTSAHKGNTGDYHVHVYYKAKDGEQKMVAATKTTVGQGQLTGHVAIPSQGRFTFTEQVNVKNEAKLSAKTEFVFNKGESVNYDRTLDADAHQWISYVSYSGTRRYIPIAALKVVEKPTVAPTTAPSTAPTEAPVEVKLSGKVEIQNSSAQGFDVVVKDITSPKALDGVSIPVWSAKNGQDDLVWYGAVKQADNSYKATVKTSDHKGDLGDYHIHVYYRFKDGSHNIVAATKTNLTTPTAAPSTAPTAAPATEVVGRLDIPSQGRFTFTEQVNVKNEAKLSAKTEFVFNKGESVNYDRTLDADAHQWISYVSYSGTRRYIPIAALKVVEKPTVAPTTAPTVAPVEVKMSGQVDIQNKSAQGFDVVVKNVTSPKELAEVQVPVWSAQAGQDDLVWYVAAKQADNSYKTTVKTSAHKGNTGDYHVHVYYKAKDGEHKMIAATTTVVPTAKQNELTYNGNYYVVQGKYEPVLIVNKTHAMSATYNPGEDPTAKAAFVRLRDDMINRGFNVGQHYSGFRSYETQKTLYQNYVARDGQAQADRYSARPGHSEHQSGLAYDLTDRSGQLLTDAQATSWLKDNAHRYGFVVRYPAGKEAVTGYMQEDWHIRYIGKEANEVKASGLTLEEYYGVSGGHYQPSTTTSTPAPAARPTLPVRGTFTFGTRAEIKAEAKKSSPVLAYYEAGQSVNYDSVLESDGLQWISYIAGSGARRYIAVNN